MAKFSWADLQPELLCCVANHLGLKWYTSARGACKAWRRALLVAADVDGMWRPHSESLSSRRYFNLAPVSSGCCRVGSSNGWLALSFPLTSMLAEAQAVFVLFNLIEAVEIVLPAARWVSKVVFTPRPTKEDFAAAAICGVDRIAYVTSGARRWAVMDPVRLTSDDQLTDIFYTDNGDLLGLPESRRREPALEPLFSVLSASTGPTTAEGLDIYVSPTWLQRGVPPGSSMGPHMNALATVEPLLSEANLPFNPATVFAPPYDTVSAMMRAKNLVLCNNGSLYQVWRNASCAMILRLPGGDQHRVSENEVIVLKYYPQLQPCWDAVNDLRGYSLFVGRNSAVAMYAEGVPGLKGNCVYWIGGHRRDQGMVFDMATRESSFLLLRESQHGRIKMKMYHHQHRNCSYNIANCANSLVCQRFKVSALVTN
jgi:hypothetical protein